ncbi:hypothetical protein MKQ70_24815 [Chitinophaga sedimenti]|uniref:hypothetical protein n=1 Tax=Chitinophaga sedimenti TaxID=2033606 RepID=UPI0020061340|nr:hypothetical protein [Chitinophaga sedimenti]MCK7558053.1 hypothetical protein [Chitinophaga sedimenti]
MCKPADGRRLASILSKKGISFQWFFRQAEIPRDKVASYLDKPAFGKVKRRRFLSILQITEAQFYRGPIPN